MLNQEQKAYERIRKSFDILKFNTISFRNMYYFLDKGFLDLSF